MFTNQINRSLTGENEDCGNGETPLVNPSGFITSIDQDKNGMYDNHLDCQWTIRLGFDSVIVFEVLTIDIYEQSVDCKGDFIEVRKSGLNLCMYSTLGQGQEMTFTFNTHIHSYIQLYVCSY